MTTITRRTFLQQSGVATGLPFILPYAAQGETPAEKIRIGVIGTGGRGQQHLREGLWINDDLEIVAVANVYHPHQRGGVLRAWLANAQMGFKGGLPTAAQKEKLKSITKPTPYYDFREMLAAEAIDAVVIATPPHTHHDIVMACLDAGKHVFVEIPLATSIEDGRAIVKKAHETALVVQVGHQHRYSPNYNLAYKRYRERHALGRLTGAHLTGHANRSGRRVLDDSYPFNEREKQFIDTDLDHHLNWRLYLEPDGGYFLDRLARQIDTVNWFCGTAPARVATFGGVDYWEDGRTTPDNATAIFEYEQGPHLPGFAPVEPRNNDHDGTLLNRPQSLRCTWSFGMANAFRDRGEYLFGDQGTLSFERPHDVSLTPESWARTPYLRLPEKEKRAIIEKVFHLDPAKPGELEKIAYYLTAGSTTFPTPEALRNYPTPPEGIFAAGSEEDSEVHQFRAFARHIRHGGTPRANVMVGLAAVIAGASARKSYETGQPVDIDPAWMNFDFETPPTSDYDHDVSAIDA